MAEIPSAELHTPDELLANAIAMQDSGDPKVFRAAILESITALEAYVQRTVFKSLEGKIDPLLVNWLEDKTKMDFDSRLSILAPVATGLPVDKASTLWDDYKKAKDIRNKVVHSGRKVSANDVATVIGTVRDWLSYLGSTLELERMLLELKRWVEDQSEPSVSPKGRASLITARYFQRLAEMSVEIDTDYAAETGKLRSAQILNFNPRKVLLETKFVENDHDPREEIDTAVKQVNRARKSAKISQACVIVFIKSKAFATEDKVERHHNGEILSVLIRYF